VVSVFVCPSYGCFCDLLSFPTRRSSDLSQKVVAEVIKQKPTVRWLFLTLTVRNVYDGTELNKSLSDMSKGFNRMMKYKKINKNLVGFMRATEVTVNNI